ncbi:MAG TPA: serine/threonine-protein kinase [Myxococcales bacterium]|jgi:serine/threonine-protein kinase
MAPSPLDDYHLERRLGTGRLGEAWLARRLDSRDPFLVRRLPGFLTEDRAAAERFLEDLQLLRLLRHPNLARLVDAGWSEGRCLVVTEYVEGIALADCLRADRGPLPASLAVELVAQAGEGLAYAHTALGPDGTPLGKVHGELCPENLLFDDAGLVRILDFGLARAAALLTVLRVDPRRAAVRYLAPEQLRDDAVSPRSDIHALGAVLFSLATGRRPLESVDDPVDLVCRLCQEGIPTTAEALPGVPEPVREAIRQATSLAPARRFATMNELTACLDAYLKSAAPPHQEELKQLVRYWAWTGRGEDPRSTGTSVIVSPELLSGPRRAG